MLQLLKININFEEFRLGALAFVTAFALALLLMPPLIRLIKRFRLLDQPDKRKEHSVPVPTMGGIASGIAMLLACLFWFRFTNSIFTISFFLSIFILMVIGIMDDVRSLPARYKLVLELAVGLLIAFSGVRLTGFNGFLGIHELPLAAQYTLTVLAITGITNAFNLIDGIDGLAGGLGFMSLLTLGLFLTFSGDGNYAVIAFALGGGLLGFLYYNFNPARIFMGDTGSLVLGFIVSVLCIRLIQINLGMPEPVVPHSPVFALGIVAIPVFDTLRVFALRIWQGKSPFDPDKNHIHHVLTNNGWTHQFTAKIICVVHSVILVVSYFLKSFSQFAGFLTLLGLLLVTVFIFQRLRPPGSLNKKEFIVK